MFYEKKTIFAISLLVFFSFFAQNMAFAQYDFKRLDLAFKAGVGIPLSNEPQTADFNDKTRPFWSNVYLNPGYSFEASLNGWITRHIGVSLILAQAEFKVNTNGYLQDNIKWVNNNRQDLKIPISIKQGVFIGPVFQWSSNRFYTRAHAQVGGLTSFFDIDTLKLKLKAGEFGQEATTIAIEQKDRNLHFGINTGAEFGFMCGERLSIGAYGNYSSSSRTDKVQALLIGPSGSAKETTYQTTGRDNLFFNAGLVARYRFGKSRLQTHSEGRPIFGDRKIAIHQQNQKPLETPNMEHKTFDTHLLIGDDKTVHIQLDIDNKDDDVLKFDCENPADKTQKKTIIIAKKESVNGNKYTQKGYVFYSQNDLQKLGIQTTNTNLKIKPNDKINVAPVTFKNVKIDDTQKRLVDYEFELIDNGNINRKTTVKCTTDPIPLLIVAAVIVGGYYIYEHSK